MIHYTDITEKIEEILNNNLVETVVQVEPTEVGASVMREVGISLAAESNTERTMGTSNPYDTTLSYILACVEFSPDGVKESSRKRDTLVGQVRDILHANRTLDGLVDNTQFGDTEFESARGEGGFFCVALITLRVFVSS